MASDLALSLETGQAFRRLRVGDENPPPPGLGRPAGRVAKERRGLVLRRAGSTLGASPADQRWTGTDFDARLEFTAKESSAYYIIVSGSSTTADTYTVKVRAIGISEPEGQDLVWNLNPFGSFSGEPPACGRE